MGPEQALEPDSTPQAELHPRHSPDPSRPLRPSGGIPEGAARGLGLLAAGRAPRCEVPVRARGAVELPLRRQYVPGADRMRIAACMVTYNRREYTARAKKAFIDT